MKYGKYFKDVSNLEKIDVYRILDLYEVTDHALGHAIKKLLLAGSRTGGKGAYKDITEARDTLSRYIEMQSEDGIGIDAPAQDLPPLFIDEMAFKYTPTEHETGEFDLGEPLTKEELSTENWYCLQHDGEVVEALVSLGVQVWEKLLWKEGLWECCMLDGHKTAARPYDADVLEVLKRENPDAYEIRLINGQFYRA